MNKLKNLADKGKNLAQKQVGKLKNKDLKVDFKIEIKLVKLTVKPTAQLPDLMYRLEWKRGPDTYASKLIDVKAGSEDTEKAITEQFSKISSFHTKEMDKEISEDTVWERKICNFILKRQDEMNQVAIAQIEIDMSTLINKQNELQTISSFKLENGYDNVELQVEWTIVKSDHVKVAHNHEHNIDVEEFDDDADHLSKLERAETLKESIVGGKFTGSEVNEFLENINYLEQKIATLDTKIDEQIDIKQAAERSIKAEKDVNKYLNKNIIEQVKDSKQVIKEIEFLTLLQEKLNIQDNDTNLMDVGQNGLHDKQISEIKQMVSAQKIELGTALESRGYKQEEEDHPDSDEDNEMSILLKHDKKIAQLKQELALLQSAHDTNEIDHF